MKKPKLVEGWRKSWKWFSVQAMVVSTAILSTWAVLPADLKAKLPEDVGLYAAIATLVLGVAGRLVDQGDARS